MTVTRRTALALLLPASFSLCKTGNGPTVLTEPASTQPAAKDQEAANDELRQLDDAINEAIIKYDYGMPEQKIEALSSLLQRRASFRSLPKVAF